MSGLARSKRRDRKSLGRKTTCTRAALELLESRALLSGGFTVLDAPGAIETHPTGVSGTSVVGWYNDGGMYDKSFLFNGSTYTPISPPGSIHTIATGISGNNVVGWYYDAGVTAHGFLYNGSSYTTIDPPGSSATYVNAVSGNFVVGYDYNGTSYQGFLFNANGSSYSSINPAANVSTIPTGVSGNSVAGSYGGGRFVPEHGFLFNGTSYTTIDPPGSTDTFVTGISGDDVVGYYENGDGSDHAFLFDGSNYTTLNPSPSNDAVATAVSGDDVVGYYYDNPGASGPTHGFLYDGSDFTVIDPPGSVGTTVTGVSGSAITGSYFDGTTTHGFLYTTAQGIDYRNQKGGTATNGVNLGAITAAGIQFVGEYLGTTNNNGYLRPSDVAALGNQQLQIVSIFERTPTKASYFTRARPTPMPRTPSMPRSRRANPPDRRSTSPSISIPARMARRFLQSTVISRRFASSSTRSAAHTKSACTPPETSCPRL